MTQLVIVLLILVVFLLSRDDCVMGMVKDTIKRFTRRKKKFDIEVTDEEPDEPEEVELPPQPVTVSDVEAAPEVPDEALPLGEAITGTESGDVGNDTFMNSRELGGNWEPNYYDDALKLTEDKKDYVNSIKSNVDSEIINSHNEYVKDSDFLATTGSSHASSRDDFNPPVGWHGLPRRAHFASVGADKSARVFQSETAADIDHYRSHHSTEYCL